MRLCPQLDHKPAFLVGSFILLSLVTCTEALHCPIHPYDPPKIYEPKQCSFNAGQSFDCEPVFDSAFYLHKYFKLNKQSCTDAHARSICAPNSKQKEVCAVEGLHSCVQHLCWNLNETTFDPFCRAFNDPKAHYLQFGIKENIPMHSGSKVVKIILMHKDDWPMLRNWILYHAHVFGMQNLIILDESGHNEPKTYLKRMQKLGLTVLRGGDRFNTVVNDINKVFDLLRWSGDYFIKLDTDEFLVKSGELPSVNATEITRVIDDLALGGQRAHLNTSTFTYVAANSSCWPLNPTFRRNRLDKGFLPSPTFRDADLGFHQGSSKDGFNDKANHEIPLTLLHFQFQCYEQWVRGAGQACESHGYVQPGSSIAERIAKLKPMQPNFPNSCSFNSCHKVFIYWHHLADPTANRDVFRKVAGTGGDQTELHFQDFNSLMEELSDSCIPHGV